MSSSKRRRSSQGDDGSSAMPVTVTGKLLSLKEALLDEGFPGKNVEECTQELLPIYNRWLYPVRASDIDRRLRFNQGLDLANASVTSTQSITQGLQLMDEDAATVRKLSQMFQSITCYSADTDSDVKLKSITRNILQAIWFTRMNLFSYVRILNLSCMDVPSFSEDTNKDSRDNIYWYDLRLQENSATVDKRQRLIGHLLFHFSIRGYRKVESDPEFVYTQKVISQPDGTNMYNTFTWERSCTIKTAIFELCRKEEQSELWNIVLSDREVTNAETYLRNCIDHEFRMVEFQRRKYSFQDGVYDGDSDTFVLYSDGVMHAFPELDRYGTFMFIDQPFYPAYQLEPSMITCPAFESIMIMQNWSQQCIELMYTLIGRLMFKVGERDNWQIMPYLIGEAGTGKSTIIELIQKLVPAPLTGVFGSGGEAQFGTQDWDKLALIIFPEVKPNEFKKSMPLGKWFSLIAGDSVCLAAKFKAPKYVPKFPTHMIAAGNESPDWQDCSGAFTRRTACFPFRVKLNHRNPDLPKKIEMEIPKILRKSLCCYNRAIQQYAGKDLWSTLDDGSWIMPQEVREESQRMQKSTTPMLDFLLDNEYCNLDPESEVSREDFIKVFDAFIRNVRHGYPLRWSNDLISHSFQMLNLTVESTPDGEFIRGVKLKKSCV